MGTAGPGTPTVAKSDCICAWVIPAWLSVAPGAGYEGGTTSINEGAGGDPASDSGGEKLSDMSGTDGTDACAASESACGKLSAMPGAEFRRSSSLWKMSARPLPRLVT
jgi:hypothetical protein